MGVYKLCGTSELDKSPFSGENRRGDHHECYTLYNVKRERRDFPYKV
jgi:hypothetical protein